LCQGDSIILNAGSGFSEYLWSTGSSTQTEVVFTTNNVWVIVTDTNNCIGTDTTLVTFLYQPDATILTTQLSHCLNGSSISFNAQDPSGTWLGAGITSNGNFVPQNAGIGLHSIHYIISGHCSDSDSVLVAVFDIPHLHVITNDESCMDASDGFATVEIQDGMPPYIIEWSNGSQHDSIFHLNVGSYSISVTDDNSCRNTLDFQIHPSITPCDTIAPTLYIPNAFSPNGDGQNDVFLVRGEEIMSVEMSIFDRWGEQIFHTTEKMNGWDGKYNGELCAPAVYVYYVKVIFNNSEEAIRFGNVTLVR
jgi:gliding motility-associated-like protein